MTEIESKIAKLEGTEAAILLPSFDDALKSVMKVLLHPGTPGEHILASSAISDRTKQILTSDKSVETTFITPNEQRRWKQELRQGTRFMFVQNPPPAPAGSGETIDMRPMHLLAKSRGTILVLDLSLASPDDGRLLEHEADILVHSCTRYDGKLGDISCGVVAGAAPLIEEIRIRHPRHPAN